MRLARVRAPEKNYVRLFDFAVRTRSTSSPENRRQTDDARRVSSPVAAVDVVRPDHRANEFLRHVVQLIGGFRTTEHAKRARPALLHLRAESRRNAIQCFVPARRPVLPVLSNQGRLQSILPFAIHFRNSPALHFFNAHIMSLIASNFYLATRVTNA